jgi:hypothetical protein
MLNTTKTHNYADSLCRDPKGSICAVITKCDIIHKRTLFGLMRLVEYSHDQIRKARNQDVTVLSDHNDRTTT